MSYFYLCGTVSVSRRGRKAELLTHVDSFETVLTHGLKGQVAGTSKESEDASAISHTKRKRSSHQHKRSEWRRSSQKYP